MLHFVMSYMKQNKNRRQTLESAQYRLEITIRIVKIYVNIKIRYPNTVTVMISFV